MFRALRFTHEAKTALSGIEAHPAQQGLLKQVRKTLGLLQTNPGHPSLKTHEYSSLRGANGKRVWEAYAQNNTPGAYRVFFHYGPDETKEGVQVAVLTIVAITPHP